MNITQSTYGLDNIHTVTYSVNVSSIRYYFIDPPTISSSSLVIAC